MKFIQSVIKLGQLVKKLKGNTDAHTYTNTHTRAYSTLILWIFAFVNEMEIGKNIVIEAV